LTARRGIAEQLPQRLFIGQRVKQFLIGQGGGEQKFPLAVGEGVGRKSAQQILDVFILHDRSPNCLPSIPKAACGSAHPRYRSY
jgi:hypothetical protein